MLCSMATNRGSYHPNYGMDGSRWYVHLSRLSAFRLLINRLNQLRLPTQSGRSTKFPRRMEICFPTGDREMGGPMRRNGASHEFDCDQLRSSQILSAGFQLTDPCYLGILAFKLWLIHQRSSRIRTTRSQVYPVLLIIIECGALYSVSLVAMLATYLSASNISDVVVDMVHIPRNERRGPPTDSALDRPNCSNHLLPDYRSDSDDAVQ